PSAYKFGNLGRNTVEGPGMQLLDLALTREFRITESTGIQFRTEFFNALNHTNLGTPNRFVNTPQFGTITMAMHPGREIQFGARLGCNRFRRSRPRPENRNHQRLCTRFGLCLRQGFEKAYQPRLRRDLRQSWVAPGGPGGQWHDLSAYLRGAARHRAERTPS